jgi:hypothetical protein
MTARTPALIDDNAASQGCDPGNSLSKLARQALKDGRPVNVILDFESGGGANQADFDRAALAT